MTVTPIPVYVGSSPWGMDAESDMVLEYSIRKHASVPVEIVWMRADDDPASPWSGWNRERWATPFSGFRWAVAETAAKAGHRRAIYTDNDVLFLGDIAELWNADMGGFPIMAREPGRLCVSVWDCEAARAILPPVAAQKPASRMHALLSDKIGPEHIAPLDPAWNCLDGEDLAIADIRALHFTDMSTQPAAALAEERLHYRVARSASRRPCGHWYTGERREHRRPDAVALFHRHFRDALDAGHRIADYEPPFR